MTLKWSGKAGENKVRRNKYEREREREREREKRDTDAAKEQEGSLRASHTSLPQKSS